MGVCAVVVTYNRRALLRECLAALAAQHRAADHVLVVDNASTDGTPEMIRAEYPEVELLALASNGGGAGGFHAGLAHAHTGGHEWIWLMDDDTMAEPAALEELLQAPVRAGLVRPPALLSSRVVWQDGRLHPMNWPGFEREDTAAVIEGARYGLVPLRTATFVSLLVHRGTIDRHELPLRRYFIWSDDIEYTARVTRHETAYLVPTSVVLHKTAQPYTALNDSGERFYFHVRNTLYMIRGSAWRLREKPSLMVVLITGTVAYLRHNRFSRRAVLPVLRGLRDGLAPGAPVPARP